MAKPIFMIGVGETLEGIAWHLFSIAGQRDEIRKPEFLSFSSYLSLIHFF